MKTLTMIIFIMAVAFTLPVQAQTFKVDTGKSELKWTGKKVLGQHYGKISLKDGEFSLLKNKVQSGKFVIDMNSITCEDLPAGETNNNLVGHLKSDDFFGVQKHPFAELVLTGSSVMKNGKAKLIGKLTIKGITHPVEFEGIQKENTFTATITVDRSKYDVRYGSGKFFKGLGDNLIYDNFTLEVKLVTPKN